MNNSKVIRGHWEDQRGFWWMANINMSTRYPNGRFNKIVLESIWGVTTWIRYNEVGQPIAGNLSLKYVEDDKINHPTTEKLFVA